MTLRLRGDREERPGLQTCLEGRVGSKEKQKESYLWRKRGFRVKLPAAVKTGDGIFNAWKNFNFFCGVIGSGLEEADGDCGVAEGSPPSYSLVLPPFAQPYGHALSSSQNPA